MSKLRSAGLGLKLGLGLGLAAVLAVATGTLRAAPRAGTIPRLALDLDLGRVRVGEAGFGSGWTFASGLFFRTGHRMGTGVLIERYSVPMAPGAAGLPVAGRLSMATLALDEHLYVLTRGPVLPYFLAGIGFAFPAYHPEDWPEGVTERVFVQRLALRLGGGLDVRVFRGLALCVKARCNLVKTWMEDAGRIGPIRETDPLAQSMLRLYGLELGLGIKITL